MAARYYSIEHSLSQATQFEEMGLSMDALDIGIQGLHSKKLKFSSPSAIRKLVDTVVRLSIALNQPKKARDAFSALRFALATYQPHVLIDMCHHYASELDKSVLESELSATESPDWPTKNEFLLKALDDSVFDSDLERNRLIVNHRMEGYRTCADTLRFYGKLEKDYDIFIKRLVEILASRGKHQKIRKLCDHVISHWTTTKANYSKSTAKAADTKIKAKGIIGFVRTNTQVYVAFSNADSEECLTRAFNLFHSLMDTCINIKLWSPILSLAKEMFLIINHRDIEKSVSLYSRYYSRIAASMYTLDSPVQTTPIASAYQELTRWCALNAWMRYYISLDDEDPDETRSYVADEIVLGFVSCSDDLLRKYSHIIDSVHVRLLLDISGFKGKRVSDIKYSLVHQTLKDVNCLSSATNWVQDLYRGVAENPMEPDNLNSLKIALLSMTENQTKLYGDPLKIKVATRRLRAVFSSGKEEIIIADLINEFQGILTEDELYDIICDAFSEIPTSLPGSSGHEKAQAMPILTVDSHHGIIRAESHLSGYQGNVTTTSVQTDVTMDMFDQMEASQKDRDSDITEERKRRHNLLVETEKKNVLLAMADKEIARAIRLRRISKSKDTKALIEEIRENPLYPETGITVNVNGIPKLITALIDVDLADLDPIELKKIRLDLTNKSVEEKVAFRVEDGKEMMLSAYLDRNEHQVTIRQWNEGIDEQKEKYLEILRKERDATILNETEEIQRHKDAFDSVSSLVSEWISSEMVSRASMRDVKINRKKEEHRISSEEAKIRRCVKLLESRRESMARSLELFGEVETTNRSSDVSTKMSEMTRYQTEMNEIGNEKPSYASIASGKLKGSRTLNTRKATEVALPINVRTS